jgi:hypothetical protein
MNLMKPSAGANPGTRLSCLKRSPSWYSFVAAAVTLLTSAVDIRAQTGPTINLRYRGQIEGLPAVAQIGFEDTRSGINPPGFVLAGGRPAWARINALIGRILVGGEVGTATAHYTFFGEVQSTSDFGFMDVTRTDGFERFRVRLDFTADENFIYIDRFALVVNPFDPPTTTSYLFELDVPVQPVAPVLAAIPNQTVNRGGVVTFTASATDANSPAQTLTFSLDPGAPAGATIHPTSGVFSWTPGAAQGPGTYTVTVRVTDNGSPSMSDTKAFTIIVAGTLSEPRVTGIVLSPEGVATVHWEGSPGATCRLLFKTNVTALEWTLVGATVMTTNSAALEDRATAGAPRRFYCVEEIRVSQ